MRNCIIAAGPANGRRAIAMGVFVPEKNVCEFSLGIFFHPGVPASQVPGSKADEDLVYMFVCARFFAYLTIHRALIGVKRNMLRAWRGVAWWAVAVAGVRCTDVQDLYM